MAGTNNKTAAEAAKDVAATPAATDNSADLQKQVDKLTKALATANEENTSLQNQLTDERTRSGNLAGELNEAENLVEDLQKQLATAAMLQEQSDTVIVSDGASHYKVLAPKFKHKHVEYTAEELRTNPELVLELVAAGVGFLQPVTAKNEE